MGIRGDQHDGDHLRVRLQVDFEQKENTFWVGKNQGATECTVHLLSRVFLAQGMILIKEMTRKVRRTLRWNLETVARHKLNSSFKM